MSSFKKIKTNSKCLKKKNTQKTRKCFTKLLSDQPVAMTTGAAAGLANSDVAPQDGKPALVHADDIFSGQ